MFEQHKNIYQHAGKCDNQQNIKDVLDADMMSTPEGVTDKTPNLPMTSTPAKKPSARKLLCLFTNVYDVKNKTAKGCIGDAKPKHRSMKVGNNLRTKKTKRKRHSKINEQIKRNLYEWITCHSQVVQSPIYNYCLKVILDD